MARPAGPYSPFRKSGNLIATAGQVGIDDDLKLVSDDFGAQVKQALVNLGDVLSDAGVSFDDVVKTTVFVTDIANFPEMNEIYLSVFSNPLPARSTVCVSALPLGAKFEIEAWAEVQS